MERMNVELARRRLGAGGVGLVVVLSAIAYLYQLPSTFFPHFGGPWYADFAALAAFYLAYAAISLPFDVMGGFLIPWQVQGRSRPFPVFLLEWARGAGVQGIVMTLAGLAVLEAGKQWGYWATVGTVLVLQVALVAGQTSLAQLTGGLAAAKAPAERLNAEVFESADAGFCGGVAGLPGMERVVAPQRWLRSRSPEALEAELQRRAGVVATGTRRRGVLAALGWNLGGYMISAAMPWVRLDSVYGVLQVFLGCTLWSFLGLLVLPAFSRAGVLEADRWAVGHGASPESVVLATTGIGGFEDEGLPEARGIARWFRAAPAREERLKALDEGRKTTGAWQASQMALYLSWAHFGLLSRMAHGIAGRPALWVIPPEI